MPVPLMYGQRMHHDVRPKFKWTAQGWSGNRIVNHHWHTVFMHLARALMSTMLPSGCNVTGHHFGFVIDEISNGFRVFVISSGPPPLDVAKHERKSYGPPYKVDTVTMLSPASQPSAPYGQSPPCPMQPLTLRCPLPMPQLFPQAPHWLGS